MIWEKIHDEPEFGTLKGHFVSNSLAGETCDPCSLKVLVTKYNNELEE